LTQRKNVYFCIIKPKVIFLDILNFGTEWGGGSYLCSIILVPTI